MLTRLLLAISIVCSFASAATGRERLVESQAEFARAASEASPGDVILLKDGEWRDFDMIVRGQGRDGAPITVTAQTKGQVFLTGQSSLRIAGEYIHVSGLVFKNGHSPRGEVVSFRVSDQELANRSRISEIVIDGYSKPDRYESDYWVGMYGKNNRFDHNHLVGKTNKGVTLAVRLNSEASRENGHRIDHNYFGPRPVLGSNGGETLRIGTSHYSMFDSNTVVENNMFDRCDGEVEIISAKSGGNTIRGNLFLRSRGAVVLRHGDGNLVERNIFMGHGKDYTGGLRVINRNQIVRDNYMEGLRGTAFSSALSVMNGVPNSPVNRYVEVDNARIENNSILDSARITFGLGADEERSAPAKNTTFAKNLLQSSGDDLFVKVDGDVAGIAFSGNRTLSGKIDAGLGGLGRENAELERAENGLLYPADPQLSGVGAPRDLTPIRPDEVGVSWYEKPGDDRQFGSSGNVIRVGPGTDTLFDAVMAAEAGDVLELAAGDYVVERTILLDKPVTIRGVAHKTGENAVIRFARPSLIELREGADLQLTGLTIDGGLAPDSAGSAVIRTTSFPIKSNFQVEMERVTVRDLSINRSFHVLALGKSAFADRVVVRNSKFENISGAIVTASTETEDYGQYNVEYLEIAGNSFANVGGAVADIYRGGRDESTFGPFVDISQNDLSNVGKARTNGTGASIRLHGVQTAAIAGNTVTDSAPLKVVHTVGTPKTNVARNSFAATPAPVFEELVFDGPFRVMASNNTVDGARIE